MSKDVQSEPEATEVEIHCPSCGMNYRGQRDSLLVGAQGEAVEHQYQDRNGKWRQFLDDRHYKDTVADGTWPIRALYAAPQARKRVTEAEIDRAAQKLSECFDYPWEFMPEQGRENMRKNARTVLEYVGLEVENG